MFIGLGFFLKNPAKTKETAKAGICKNPTNIYIYVFNFYHILAMNSYKNIIFL